MSTDEDDKEEYFLRASLLLLKGGGLMSKETLSREVQKAGVNLDVLLKTHKSILEHKFSREQRNKLCLDGGTTCVDQWDLALLTTVPLTVFKQSLNDDEKKALKCIKYKRDTVYAHTHSSVLSFDDYDDIRKELEEALGVLSNGLSDIVKDECAKIIQQCTTGPINPSVKAELSKQLKGTEDLVKAVMMKLTDTQKVVLDMRNGIEDLKLLVIEDIKRHQATTDRSLKTVTVIDSELTLSAPVNESEPVDLAEEIITTVINQAIEEVGDANDYPKIRLAVKKILGDIKKIPHVEIGKAEHKCIILRFRCTSYTAVLDMLLYMESEMYKARLDALANAVSNEMFDNPSSCKLHAAVVAECLTTILHELRAESSESMQHKKTIKLPIKLQTVEGFENIWNLFEGNGALEQFQELSDAISEHLDTKITVTPSLNMDAFKNSASMKTVESYANFHADMDFIERDEAQNQASMTITESQTDFDTEIAVIEPSEEQNKRTNSLFKFVMKTKDDDSAIGGSIITSRSDKTFSVSEGYVPPEPCLGDSITVQMESDKVYTGSCTVGPIVTVSGVEEKCFITVGNNPGVLNKTKVHVSGDENTMRMLAWDSTYGTVLVAPDFGTEAEATVLGTAMAANAETLGDAASAHMNLSGLRVCKIGANKKLTEGMIIGLVENMRVEGTPEALKNAVYVETLPGANDHPFARTGDAGAMVYHEESYGSFICIGVLLGEKFRVDAHTEFFVVRLIDDILQDFKKRLGKQISLDYSTMKEQILSTMEEQNS